MSNLHNRRKFLKDGVVNNFKNITKKVEFFIIVIQIINSDLIYGTIASINFVEDQLK